MNEEEKFDELLRSKLSEREFPFDELNWDEAERLIAKQERWNKIKRFTLIFSAGLGVGVGVMLPFMLSNHAASPDAIVSKSTFNSNSAAPANTAPFANQAKENTTANNIVKKEKAPQPLQSAFVKKNTSKGMGANSSLVSSSVKTSKAGLPVVLAMRETKKKSKSHHQDNTIVLASAGETNKTTEHKELNHTEQVTDVNSSSAKNNSITKTEVATDKDNSNKTNTVADNNSISKSVTPSNNNKQDNGNTNTSNTKVTTTNKTNIKESTNSNISGGGANAPINKAVASAPAKKDTGSALQPGDIPKFAPGDFSKNILSVYAGGNYSLGWSDNGAKEGNGLTPWAGFNFTHYFTGDLSASLGIGYAEINHLNNTYTSSLIQYDFGASSVVTTVTPQTVYYLALPLNLQYNVDNKDLVSFGLDYLMLMTTVSTLTTYQQTYFTETPGSSGTQNGYTQGFSNSVMQLTLSYRRMITERLGICAEYYHDLGYIENNSISGINQYAKNSGIRVVLSFQLMK